ncbi:Leukocyte receptor cluster member 1 [Danaus plexippus plexippus]|uniref:Leukocyte receptor cluster member 1 n=1 Tax=Danaus plexippus plexippus TaxID=278856 RepID=A0A212F3Z9_DANPL|nr:Leukocyte receptor cluster member 1 [Danaus plexippus plexippus]
MNILPKKRWHVRTKENIARVRKDEAEAAEKERQEQLRIAAADREARLNVLKQKSKLKLSEFDFAQPLETTETNNPAEHINLFSDIEHALQTTNKEHDKEKKEKQEEYEKKIGYLTYLGQDTNEALGKKNWYEVPPESSRFSRSADIKDTYDKLVLKDADGKPKDKLFDEKDGEVAWKAKQSLDPMNTFKKYCSSQPKTLTKTKDTQSNKLDMHKSNKSKTSKKDKHKSDSQIKLQKLREARLKREMQERAKTEMFLSKLSGIEPVETEKKEPKKVVPKYNSQFNPELARQNFR